ncbi:MAG: succinylglutamate desuccinylase/aspartoacylase family protein [Alphaproteobacteria bacterium]|nr:succinylglutamate desuccinylase/aspartoacylase family protein [Alphaproteobacteria bacterium]
MDRSPAAMRQRRQQAADRRRRDAVGWLDRFEALADGPAPFVHRHDGGGSFHVVVGVCVHGDEVGTLPAAVALIDDLRQGRRRFGGRLDIVLGNPGAVRAGTRCVDSDLNRVFVPDRADDTEGRRAGALMPLFDACDLFVDLHQTGAPTLAPFYTLPWRRRDDDWARALGASHLWVTRRSGESFSPGTCCADEYVRAQGKPGLTVELSRKGIDGQTTRHTTEILDRLLVLAETPGDIQAAAAASRPLRYLQTVHREPFVDARQQLRPELCNLMPVHAHELLSVPQSPLVIAPRAGVLLFPKFPPRDADGRAKGPVTGELFHLAAELEGHPAEVWGEA